MLTLEGAVERITYVNEQNGYTVAKLTPTGKDYLVTVVGNLPNVQPGESVRLEGVWTTHPQHGRQFEAKHCTVERPASVEGIRKYLGSGLVKGIGPGRAERIVETFGEYTLDVIERSPDRLVEVPGIGPKTASKIMRAWEEQRAIKDVMVFLQGHGVSTGLAVKIYKQYRNEALVIVQNDPYRLARDIYGIGFLTADKIARNMGFAIDDPRRIEAGVAYVLNEFSDGGHVFALRPDLVALAVERLSNDETHIAPEGVEAAIDRLTEVGELKIEDGDDGPAVYLPPFYQAEVGVARRLRRALDAQRDRLASFRDVNWERALAYLARDELELAPQQAEAVKVALTHKVAILTGGPGTGKTYTLRAILKLLEARRHSVLLAAPTGRAAKRINEATGHAAKTLHRLLEFKPGQSFIRDEQNPLDADMVIVDETSMIDLLLMNSLMKAVDVGSHLLLVGDVDQLPSVGAGNVLRDLIASEVIPVVRLETIFRQAEESGIVVNAHRINAGQMPVFSPTPTGDFFWVEAAEPTLAADRVLQVVAERIPKRWGLDALDDVQVLTPTHRGEAGVAMLNQRLQAILNPPAEGKTERPFGSRVFRVGDKVLQIRNNYDKKVFNGDVGRIEAIDLEDQVARVRFDTETVEYEFQELDELVHAFAMSVHKAQGSEYPAVVMPLVTQHYMLLQRNLVYTGVTRAKRLVVMVGQKRALGMAVRNARLSKRNSRLAQRLRAQDPIDATARAFGLRK
ncbi:MAG: ATP-dependent RecD-like DNA helicase [Anaerolineae bacterium]